MNAILVRPDGLKMQEVPSPTPSADQVLVRVTAAGINRADLGVVNTVAGSDTRSSGRPIGMEWSGEIVALGQNVRSFDVGQRVMCSGTGGYAEYAVADHGRTLSIENTNLSDEQACVLPLALMTAHDALVTNGRLMPGESILVHGASSAVGLMSLRLAKWQAASLVVATSTNNARRACLNAFGADLVVDSTSNDWPEQVLNATGSKGVQLVVDMVSGPTVNAIMRSACVRGRIVNVGRLGGNSAGFDFDLHALKRLEYIGVTFRTRSLEEIRHIVQKMHEDLWPLVASGSLNLPIDKTFALADAPAAHAYMAANKHFGKLVLKP